MEQKVAERPERMPGCERFLPFWEYCSEECSYVVEYQKVTHYEGSGGQGPRDHQHRPTVKRVIIVDQQ